MLGKKKKRGGGQNKKLENQNLQYSGSSQIFTFVILQKHNKFQGIEPQFQTPGFNL